MNACGIIALECEGGCHWYRLFRYMVGCTNLENVIGGGEAVDVATSRNRLVFHSGGGDLGWGAD